MMNFWKEVVVDYLVHLLTSSENGATGDTKVVSQEDRGSGRD